MLPGTSAASHSDRRLEWRERHVQQRQIVFLVYFLLAYGDLFKRKIVKIAGPALSSRRITVEALEEIQRSLERFVLVILATNAVVGVASFVAFRAIGLKPPKASVATMSLNLRNRLLATGRFLTMLPGYSVKFRDRYPPLKALPVKLPDSRAAVAVVTLRNRTLSPVAQLFIETMRTIARQLKLAEPTKL